MVPLHHIYDVGDKERIQAMDFNAGRVWAPCHSSLFVSITEHRGLGLCMNRETLVFKFLKNRVAALHGRLVQPGWCWVRGTVWRFNVEVGGCSWLSMHTDHSLACKM